MKRRLLALLTVCMLVVGFSACAKDDAGGSNPTAEATKAPATEAASTESTATEAPATAGTPAESTEEPTEAPTEDPNATEEPPALDAFILDFWNEESIVYTDYLGSYDGTGPVGSAEWEWEEGSGLVMHVLKNDPYFLFEFGIDYLPLESYPIMKVRWKNSTPGVTMEMFLPRAMSSISADDTFQYAISGNNTDYVEYTIDLNIKGQDWMNGRELTGIRIDCVNLDPVAAQIPKDGSWTVTIDYIAFFPTVEDAAAYTGTHA